MNFIKWGNEAKLTTNLIGDSMSNKYFQVVATINGNKEILFGSFDKQDCKDELYDERPNWKQDGYKGFKIEAVDTLETPDKEVYQDSIVSKKELFIQQAPNFNFELDEDELLAKALERGYVTEIQGVKDQYFINSEY